MTRISFSDAERYSNVDRVMWLYSDEGLVSKVYWTWTKTQQYRVYTSGNKRRGLVAFYLHRYWADGERPRIAHHGTTHDLVRA